MSDTHASRAWAFGVIGGFILFVAGILTLVFMSMSRDVDLVTDHYYDRELKYQDRIKALERAAKPEAAITIDQKSDSIVLVVPPTVAPRTISGNVVLYRPDNPRLDRTMAIKPDDSGRQSIAARGLMPGVWRVKMEWKVEGLEYYAEKVVVIP